MPKGRVHYGPIRNRNFIIVCFTNVCNLRRLLLVLIIRNLGILEIKVLLKYYYYYIHTRTFDPESEISLLD